MYSRGGQREIEIETVTQREIQLKQREKDTETDREGGKTVAEIETEGHSYGVEVTE